MISGLIPHRYARALYKFAAGNGRTAAVYGEMKRVIASFASNPGLEKTLANPFVGTGDKQKLLLAAAGGQPGDDYRRFVKLVIDHKREAFAYLMALAYRDIYRRENHISQVTIATAAPLPESEVAKLRSVVERNFKGNTFEYSYAVEPGLIGGFRIDVDSARMDASLSSELEQLRQTLTMN